MKTKKFYDTVGGIIKYEQSEMEYDEVVELFQHLGDTGLAWQLQGHYGRTAAEMIRAGEVTQNYNQGEQ